MVPRSEIYVGMSLQTITLPETNSSHLKMDDWKTSFLLGLPIFRGYVKFRGFSWIVTSKFQAFSVTVSPDGSMIGASR